MGNASFSPADGHIDLTPDPYGTMNISSNETATTMALQNCIGRVLYRQQLTMWPASFTTVFTIFVKNITTNGTGYASILNHTLELENTVPRSAYVGFSAATGNSYEIHRILDWNFSSVMLPESSLNFPPVGTGTPGGLRRWVKIGILMGSIAVGLVVVGLVGFVVWRMRKKKQPTLTLGRGSFSGELAIMQNAPHRYSYKQLVAATDNFSEAELLGTGGFGSVYRGNLNAGRNEQLRPTVRQAIQVLINPSEELPQLPSTRPMAIYVVLPPAGAGFSLSTSSSIMGGGAASSSLMAETSVGSITTSITKGR
ncbi:hypothetical protein SUGI_0644450 [Cryptomeria japonica]|nr:hypothetical protein SUGI_0644450 [Cryptomeria japonica]